MNRNQYNDSRFNLKIVVKKTSFTYRHAYIPANNKGPGQQLSSAAQSTSRKTVDSVEPRHLKELKAIDKILIG